MINLIVFNFFWKSCSFNFIDKTIRQTTQHNVKKNGKITCFPCSSFLIRLTNKKNLFDYYFFGKCVISSSPPPPLFEKTFRNTKNSTARKQETFCIVRKCGSSASRSTRTVCVKIVIFKKPNFRLWVCFLMKRKLVRRRRVEWLVKHSTQSVHINCQISFFFSPSFSGLYIYFKTNKKNHTARKIKGILSAFSYTYYI